MRVQVNNISSLLRVPAYCVGNINHRFWGNGRKLHSDSPSECAARAAPALAVEARAPLTDLLGRRHDYLRISLTERCNLRCQYCMPAEGVPLSPKRSLLSREELSRCVRMFAALGVRKVRLTGGEPTLRGDLADVIQEIRSVPGIEWVAMTTNGLALTRRLAAYQRAGLGAVNVSLDSLQPPRYEHMARRPGLKKVLAGIDLALQLGYRPVKINVVLMKGFNDDEICDFVEYTRDREVEVRFIEFMPFTGNAWDDSKLVPHKEVVRALLDRFPHALPCLPRPNDTARVWKVPGYSGSVGFISSMTNHFCSTCNRLRLTADGNLKVCLFGAAEVSLRDAVRQGASDHQLEDMVRAALRNKKPQHAESQAHGQPAHDSDRRLTDFAVPSHNPGRLVLPKLRDYVSATALLANSAFLAPRAASSASVRAFSTLSTAFLSPPSILSSFLSPTSFPASKRQFSSDSDSDPTFSHLDSSGKARMVDVGEKQVTSRVAEAECSLVVGGRLIRLLRDANLPKGDALTVAQVAGVLGAKKTSELIPMCHPLPLDCVRIRINLPKGENAAGGNIIVHCEVRCTARTGVEMEALTGAATAALALYDMCKSVDKNMRVTNLRVVHKSGGKSGTWSNKHSQDVKVRDYDTSPIKKDETYVPTITAYV